MKYLPALFCMLILSSCWKFNNGYSPNPLPPQPKVWGSKPVYASKTFAEKIAFGASKQPVKQAGNIYAWSHYIFQVDVGSGIHVIDNSVPSKAERVGFITINGCEQISIKGNFLYTNSYADLVTIDLSDVKNIREVNRQTNIFPENLYSYPFAMPEESGYYTCPQYYDSVVVDWVKDSVYATCFKN
jgi:hypothetical protein